ncbi:MAG: endolytic transglycosylase MltG [Bacteroidetes bacterium]|nr:endolytic transglycosylase MltG [Bacteroidota bacterium]
MVAAKKKGKLFLKVFIIVFAIIFIAAFRVFGPNVSVSQKETYLYIPTGASYNDVMNLLKDGNYLSESFSFSILSKLAKYPAHVHAGKYKLTDGMSNFNLIRMLRSGRQKPVKLVINKLRTKHDFIELVSSNLEVTDESVVRLMMDSAYLAQYGLDTNTMMALIIPDTYEFYWNTTAEKVLNKIGKNYLLYWNDNRRQLAKNKNISITDAVIIASILEEETNMPADKPNIASVYLNRLKAGIPLQADPTIKFSLNDFALRRITGAHLQVNSPYNTYIYAGLPPGPICTPSKADIEAVLNAPSTSYFYFCAKPELNGYSNFASTLEEHNKNAKAYQQALDARGIH